MTLVHVNYCTNRLIRHCLPSRIFLDPCISNPMDIQFGLNDPVFRAIYTFVGQVETSAMSLVHDQTPRAVKAMV